VRNPAGQFFQDGELAETLRNLAGRRAEATIQGIVKEATQFAAGAMFPDDLTLLAVERAK
jgi:serine phosphatase RsbU (regulator of sigma subunit)